MQQFLLLYLHFSQPSESEPVPTIHLYFERLTETSCHIIPSFTTSLPPSRSPFFLTTALSHITDIRSSMPLVPSGMAVKLSFPIAFCAVLNVQCALPETWRSPLAQRQTKRLHVPLTHSGYFCSIIICNLLKSFNNHK